MARNTIDSITLREMFSSGAALLTQNREAVDALNVFPVPDGDTGTNMSQTITAAVREMNSKNLSSAEEVADTVARGALKGARGNSGVILSQILRGFAAALVNQEEVDSSLLVTMLRSGSDMAYKAVMKPKEGTILTVIRVTAEEIERSAHGITDVEEVFRLALASAEAILKRTPDMLPVLKQAGVVDSGGMGLVVILRGMYAALTGEAVETEVEETSRLAEGDFVDDHNYASPEEIVFGYCTEFIVSHPRPDLRPTEVERLRRRLERIGDCVLVISDSQVVKVHVHTDDPGKALQMALELGELDYIKIDNMREEARERQAKQKAAAEEARKEEKEYGIVSVVLGEGFSSLFKELGADQIVDGGQTMNPSIEDLRAAAEATNARNVIILPNNSNIILAAQQAAELTERNVIVLTTKSVPMGISSLLAFDPDADAETNRENMQAAAECVHTASVTYAVRDTVFDGHDIKSGDIMGLVDNKLTLVGQDVRQICLDLTEGLVGAETSIITVYAGCDVTEADAQELTDTLTGLYPDHDVSLQTGGQPLYYYLIAVE